MKTTIPPTLSRPQALIRDISYLLISFPLRLLAFCCVLTTFSIGFSSMVMWIGIPMLIGTLYLARAIASTERRLLGWTTSSKPCQAIYLSPNPEQARWRRFITPVFDRQCWLDTGWSLTAIIISAFTWTLTVLWIAGSCLVVLGPLARLLPGSKQVGLAELLGLPLATAIDIIIEIVLGLLFALSASSVLGGLAKAQRYLSHAMLCVPAEIGKLRQARTAIQHAESRTRQRLERDIHDGPQQRLIRIALDLGRARRRLPEEPLLAAEILDQVIDQTQITLDELRQLSRGIAPPVLTDRGLSAAIQEAGALSTIPVGVDVDLPRLPMHIEQAAYFVVTESLANLNKHSLATSATIQAELDTGTLRLVIEDNGIGGADPAKGHGLSGLQQRLEGLEATLVVVSPRGGPTRVEAVIPCA